MFLSFKQIIKRFLWKTGLYKYYALSANPFKIFEWSAIKINLAKNSDALVLDLGCGNGLQTILIGKYFRKIIGIDPNAHAIKLANEKLPYLKLKGNVVFHVATVEQMRFEENSFDGVISYCVIEHISNYREVFREVLRILKPGGWIVFSIDSLATVRDSHALEKHREDHHVVKYFTCSEIMSLLTETGYIISICKPILTSTLAEVIFKSGIHNSFRFNRCVGLLYGLAIFAAELTTSRKNDGLFVLVKASKPERT